MPVTGPCRFVTDMEIEYFYEGIVRKHVDCDLAKIGLVSGGVKRHTRSERDKTWRCAESECSPITKRSSAEEPLAGVDSWGVSASNG